MRLLSSTFGLQRRGGAQQDYPGVLASPEPLVKLDEHLFATATLHCAWIHSRAVISLQDGLALGGIIP